jgi:hypothetical protein
MFVKKNHKIGILKLEIFSFQMYNLSSGSVVAFQHGEFRSTSSNPGQVFFFFCLKSQSTLNVWTEATSLEYKHVVFR